MPVASIEILFDPQPVYNLEVSGEHVYEVTELDLLVHNGFVDCEELVKLRDLAEIGKLKGKNVQRLEELEDALANFKWGEYLEKLKGIAPDDMELAHAHHILFKKGLGPKQRELVSEGMKLMLKYGLDPLYGSHNLFWAPNVKGQHVIDHLRKVVQALRKVDKMKGTKAEKEAAMIEALKKLADEAAKVGKST